MASEFEPHLRAAADRHRPGTPPDARALARYLVAVVEGSIMLARTHQDRQMMARHFAHLKEQLQQTFRGSPPAYGRGVFPPELDPGKENSP
jgi:hypothetical protein